MSSRPTRAGSDRPHVTGSVNIATGVETSVNNLYGALARVMGVAMPPRHAPPRPGEQRRSCLDPTRAQRLLGWVAAVPLEEGLARTFEFFTRCLH